METVLNRRYILTAIIISLLAIILQLIFLNPPILSDQMEYYYWSMRFPHWPETPNLEITRIGLVLPIAVLYRIFGPAEISYYLFQVVSLGVLATCIFLIASSFFTYRIGVFSALWTLLIPNLLLESGHLSPDIPATALFLSGCTLIQLGNRSKKWHFSQYSWLLFFAGLLFGWSYLVKESTAILFPLIPVLFWVLDIPLRRLIPVALGMLSMLILEMAFGIVFFNNPLFHFMAASPRETVGDIQENVGVNLVYLARLLDKTNGFGTLVILILGAVNALVHSIKREKRFLFLLAWAALVYIVFTFVGLLPVILDWEDRVLLRLHKFRYWIPLIPPLVISGVAWSNQAVETLSQKFTGIKNKSKSYFWILSLLILVAANLPGIVVINKDPDLIRNGADHYLEFRQFLKEQGQDIDTIWIDRDNQRAFDRILPFYTRTFFGNQFWNGQFKYINTGGQYLRADEIVGGYIIIDRYFMDPNLSDAPSFLTQPPPNWSIEFLSENDELALYKVN